MKNSFVRLIIMWENRLKEVKETGNFSTDPRGTPFFAKGYETLELKQKYIINKITKIIEDSRK